MPVVLRSEMASQPYGASREERRTVDGNVDNIRASSGTGDHAGGRNTRRVMGVDVDRHVWILFPDRANETATVVSFFETPSRFYI